MNRLIALVRREFWENKGALRTTPLVIGGIYVAFLLMSIFTTPKSAKPNTNGKSNRRSAPNPQCQTPMENPDTTQPKIRKTKHQ